MLSLYLISSQNINCLNSKGSICQQVIITGSMSLWDHVKKRRGKPCQPVKIKIINSPNQILNIGHQALIMGSLSISNFGKEREPSETPDGNHRITFAYQLAVTHRTWLQFLKKFKNLLCEYPVTKKVSRNTFTYSFQLSNFQCTKGCT